MHTVCTVHTVQLKSPVLDTILWAPFYFIISLVHVVHVALCWYGSWVRASERTENDNQLEKKKKKRKKKKKKEREIFVGDELGKGLRGWI